MIVQFVTHILRRMGCEVEAAGCADEALRMLKEKRYAAVLLDIRMPGMSGIELYGHIEAIASSLAKRTIFITGDVMDDSTQSFLVSSGATAVPKPFTAETLLKALLSVLRRT
jgi:CheY-like chemotaxis protein